MRGRVLLRDRSSADGSRLTARATLVLVSVVIGCGGDHVETHSEGPFVDMDGFAEAFEVVRVLTLEETDESIIVTPVFNIDAAGDLVSVEPQEAQIRIFNPDGSLKAVMGQAGAGPGEFRTPTSARRTLDGRIVVADPLLSRITFLGPDPDSVVTAISPVGLLLDVHDLGNDRLLLTGVGDRADAAPQALHIWNARTESIEHSFLSMIVSEESRGVASSFMTANAEMTGDTIWATWALSDTVYQFSRDGEELAKIPMQLPRPHTALPSFEGTVQYTEIGNALDSLTQIAGVFPTTGGDLVVQSGQMRGRLYEWDLLIMDRNGQPKLQLIGSPRLIFVQRDDFYFASLDELTPNRVLVTRRKTP